MCSSDHNTPAGTAVKTQTRLPASAEARGAAAAARSPAHMTACDEQAGAHSLYAGTPQAAETP